MLLETSAGGHPSCLSSCGGALCLILKAQMTLLWPWSGNLGSRGHVAATRNHNKIWSRIWECDAVTLFLSLVLLSLAPIPPSPSNNTIQYHHLEYTCTRRAVTVSKKCQPLTHNYTDFIIYKFKCVWIAFTSRNQQSSRQSCNSGVYSSAKGVFHSTGATWPDKPIGKGLFRFQITLINFFKVEREPVSSC